MDQAQEDLAFAPPLGDQLPSEMLAHLCRIVGRHLNTNSFLEHSLRREFPPRQPDYVRDLLTLMENPTVNKMTEKADLLVSGRKPRALLPS